MLRGDKSKSRPAGPRRRLAPRKHRETAGVLLRARANELTDLAAYCDTSFARLLASDDASELSQYREPLVFHQPAHDAEDFLPENETDNEADRSRFAGGLTLHSDAFDHLEVDQDTADRYQEYQEQSILQH